MTAAAIIVAAGRGSRAGGDPPKQWRMLAGRRVIDRCIDTVASVPEIDRIVVVLHPEDMGLYHPEERVTVVTGGDTRAASVRRGLESLAGAGIAHVLVHDVARVCTPACLFSAVLSELVGRGALAAAPALPVTDALWRGTDGRVAGTVERAGLYRAQTPQAFDFPAILAAHRAHDGAAADDVAVARAAGMEVEILPGDPDNFKITTAADFDRAEAFLRGRMDIRTGSGFDVHRFGPGDHVTLCGVTIPHDRGLQGHSDADVGMHALTDAILGAVAAGDIGQHFPPSDPRWKDAGSAIFLRHAVSAASEAGFAVSSLDVTLICESPRIGRHAPAMRGALSEITGTVADRISVKATTSEGLGFTGRGEGIAAQATATLVRP